MDSLKCVELKTIFGWTISDCRMNFRIAGRRFSCDQPEPEIRLTVKALKAGMNDPFRNSNPKIQDNREVNGF